MLSAAHLPQVRAEACISLLASWEQVNSLNCPNHVRRTKSSVKKRIIVRRTVRSMFGEQTYAQLRTCFSWQFCETYGVVSYGSGWRKGVYNQCLAFTLVHAVKGNLNTRSHYVMAEELEWAKNNFRFFLLLFFFFSFSFFFNDLYTHKKY